MQELNWFSSLPLWAIADTKKCGALMLCPHLEEHHLKVVRESYIKWLNRQVLVEADSDTTKGPACPVPSVPPRVSLDVSIIARDGFI